MDIEKLDINAVCFGILCNFTPVCGEERAKEAVELVRTLQAENEKLRADLEQVKRERDAAIQDLKKHRKYKCDCCYYADKQSRFPCTDCQSPISTYGDGWKWRGLDGRGLTWNS
nr:MAG TPA: MAD PROTEIN/MAX PROTEIN/DNA factor, DNA, bHLHZ, TRANSCRIPTION-DNA.0A [Caudoviricetes sp.]